MSYVWTAYFCFFMALWSAVIGGVFSAFSEFIMGALLRAAPASGIESMQQINRRVIKTLFVAGIISIAVLSILFSLHALLSLKGSAQLMILLAALVYLPSVFFVTVLGSVPMNNKLDTLNPQSVEAETYWPIYGRDWTRLNHLRALGCLVTACFYAMAGVRLLTLSPT